MAKTILFKSSFLFFSSSYMVYLRFEKVEFLTGGQKKEHDKGRSEPSKKEEFVIRNGCVKKEDQNQNSIIVKVLVS